MELISTNEHGFELHLTVPDTIIKDGMPYEQAQKLLELAYQPFVDKINNFLTLCIGYQDFDSLQILDDTINNIAKSKKENV